ncbi:activating signal cointegrator 1 complex subunit [Sparganum proliferum]
MELGRDQTDALRNRCSPEAEEIVSSDTGQEDQRPQTPSLRFVVSNFVVSQQTISGRHTMDTLLPPIIKIGRRLYRKNPSRSSTEIVPVGHLEDDVDLNFQGEPLTVEDVEDEFIFSGPTTVSLAKPISFEQGKYTGTVYVPKIFHKNVIGGNRTTQRKLETDLNCKLLIPNQSSPDAHIKIVAETSANISAVLSRIGCILTDARCFLPPTHFVCLPVLHPLARESFVNFREQVLKSAHNDQNRLYGYVDADLFPAESKLHFTLATLLLADEREVSFASKLLTSFATTQLGESLSKDGPFRLTIRGFDCMNDDPKSAYVLYARLLDNAEAGRLQTVANNIADLFTQHGLHSGRREIGDPVKLHMTVMNARLRCERQRSQVPTGVTEDIRPVSFNASGVLHDYGDHTLMEEGQFDEIQLCSLLGDKDTRTSFYPCVAKLSLNQANS